MFETRITNNGNRRAAEVARLLGVVDAIAVDGHAVEYKLSNYDPPALTEGWVLKDSRDTPTGFGVKNKHYDSRKVKRARRRAQRKARRINRR